MRRAERGIKVLIAAAIIRMTRTMVQTTRFSPSRGWDDVRLLLVRNSQILIALAGAFFLLPLLILSFFAPPFVPFAGDPATADPALVWAQMRDTIVPLIPWFLLLFFVQTIGQLAIMAAVTIRENPTAGEAIAIGFQRLGYYLLITLALSMLILLAMVPLLLIIGAVGAALGSASPAVAGLLGIILFGVVIAVLVYILMRFALIGVVLVAEDARGPLPVLRRSWQLTHNNAALIFAFYLIVAVVIVVISLAVSLIFGLLFSLAGLAMTPGGAGAAILALLTGTISAGGTTIFALMQAAIYRQLAGGRADEVFR